MSTRRRRKRAGLGGGAWLAKAAVAAGIARKPRPKHAAAFGVCPDHLSDELLGAMGFLDRASFVAWAETMSRRDGRARNSITLPRWKTPANILRIVARRCPKCRGRLGGAPCDACGGWSWGLTVMTKRQRETKARAAA